MSIDIERLKKLFGLDTVEDVLKDKEESKQRARPVKPKVNRVKLTAEECASLCSNVKLEYEEGYEKRVFEYTFTDETVDRYGDIVLASGADLRNYKNNPVVLAFHDGRTLPVGMSLKTWIDTEKHEVKGWVLVYDQRIDPSGWCDLVYNYVSSGAMKTGSIGFLPKEGGVKRPSDEERETMKMPRFGVIYESWELLEFSLTPLPANPSATMKGVDLFTREGLKLARESEAFEAEDITEYENIVGTTELAATPSVLSLDAETATLLTTLVTKLNLLIEKMEAAATSNERLIDTLRLCYRLSPSGEPVGEQTEDNPDKLYGDDSLDDLADAFKNING